jgi:hypothetical protein
VLHKIIAQKREEMIGMQRWAIKLMGLGRNRKIILKFKSKGKAEGWTEFIRLRIRTKTRLQ